VQEVHQSAAALVVQLEDENPVSVCHGVQSATSLFRDVLKLA